VTSTHSTSQFSATQSSSKQIGTGHLGRARGFGRLQVFGERRDEPSIEHSVEPAPRAAWRAIARTALVVLAGVAIVPVSAVSSSGAGTTAVAAATNDPIALTAASALDLLRGGSGSVRQPGTVVDSVPSSATSQTDSASGVPQTLPPNQQNPTPSVSAPPLVPPASTSNTTIVNTDQLAPKKAALVDGVALSSDADSVSESVSQFANAPAVSLLPPPSDVTVPVSVTTPAAAQQTTAPITKKTTKKTTSTIAAVQAEAASVAAPIGSTYDSVRRTLATLVAGRLQKLSADQLDAAWASADPRRMMAVYAALAQVGTNYRYSGNEPGGFDCSGLTSYAWAVAGVRLPRTSTDQIGAASPRTADRLLPGDLVWRPGHIMMYLGAGEYVIDSPQTGKKVTVRQWGRTSRYGSPV
jgi:peptidoglycan DL-endopeptidase CwlO